MGQRENAVNMTGGGGTILLQGMAGIPYFYMIP